MTTEKNLEITTIPSHYVIRATKDLETGGFIVEAYLGKLKEKWQREAYERGKADGLGEAYSLVGSEPNPYHRTMGGWSAWLTLKRRLRRKIFGSLLNNQERKV